MLATLHNVATTGYLMLADSIQCRMPRAPVISVIPETDAIQYDFSRSGRELTAQHTDTVSPYPPGTDATTGGLRVDHPTVEMQASWGYENYTPQNQFCMWYNKITVKIKLAPHIYIASEYGPGPCRDAILQHEQHHVDVDRDIVNKFSDATGTLIKDVVDKIGVVGPYNSSRLDEIGKDLSAQIKVVVDSQEKLLQDDERVRQAKVDSLQEYMRIDAICHMSGH